MQVTEVAPQYPPWVLTETEQRLHDNFELFCYHIWQHLKLPPPTRRQRAIIRYLATGPRRRMIEAFRGIGKTWLTCAYALWRLYRNANERIKIVSANEGKAVENATFTRRLIEEVELLQFLRPRRDQRDSVLAFDVGPSDAAVAPSVSCVGITGQLTGGRATILVADDIEVPKNSYTETMRERLADLVKEFDALVVPEGFDIIYLGTPQTEQSIYNTVRTRGYDLRVWPARYPTPEQRAKYGSALAPDIVADLDAGAQPRTSTDVQRFSDLDLMEREASYGRSGFALQFMLDTSLSDAERYPLKQADLLVFEAAIDQGPVRMEWTSDPRNALANTANIGFAGDRLYRPLYISHERLPWEETIIYVDPSGRGKDETGYAVLRSLRGSLYLVASGGFRDGYSDVTLRGLVALCKTHLVNKMLIEPNMGDGMFTKLIEPHFVQMKVGCTVEESERSVSQKEKRIIGVMEPVLNQHRLVITPAVIALDLKQAEEDQRYSLLYQLTHLTAEKGSLRHDDRLDALAGAVGYFEDRMSINQAQAESENLSRLRDEELNRFMASAGRSIPIPGFADRPVVGIRSMR